jgi:uncharacterized protein YyaL (SSP411 family)
MSNTKQEYKYTNSLIKETSPYLLQHAHNPVDWYPWSDEAFEKAKKENKPVFLSVGYSACHWCHVMEHESFEDEETAKIMNENFINIKVDREERPDVDTIYMNVVQMLTGHGGWPMSVFMTPDKKPYYGGTYFPKERRYHMPSFKEILTHVGNFYHQKKDSLEKNSAMIIKNLENMNSYTEGEQNISPLTLKRTVEHLEGNFDYENGGFGDKPKFPNTFSLDLFLRYYKNTKDAEYLSMVELTLTQMCNGGIYDQLGGGFYRYSVDEIWLIPHYEKMLYDNSVLIKLLLELYQITKKPFYKEKARESLEYVIREMTNSEGGFYSTQDADSEGIEGEFYVWTPKQFEEVLGEKSSKVMCKFFDITEHGNFEHGKSNLQIRFTSAEIAEKLKMDIEEVISIIKDSKPKLLEARNKRIFPAKDTKILTSWNGLMLSAFAKGYEVLKDDRYLEIANKTIDFLFKNLYKNGLLLRSYKDNQAKYNAYLEDYAFLIQSLIDLYQVTFDKSVLDKALELNKIMINEFFDESQGGFFYTGNNHEELIVRTKEVFDHSIPSGNSVALRNLIRLERITGDSDLGKRVEKCISIFSGTVNRYFGGVANLVATIDSYVKPPIDIVLTGDNVDDIKPFLNKLSESYDPDRIVYFKNSSEEYNLNILKDKVSIDGKPTAYVCENFVCHKPELI